LVSTFDAKDRRQHAGAAETAKNYELGFKSSLLDRRVYFNAALFRADYHGSDLGTSFLPVAPS